MRKIMGCFICLSLVLCFAPSITSATSLLIDQKSPLFGYGYGLYDWDVMTTALNDAFGASNISVKSSGGLSDLNALMSYDRLWITARYPDQALSSTELDNLKQFIATGRRVVLVGDFSLWYQWNNSILGAVGGSYSNGTTSSVLTPIIANELTAGVSSLYTAVDGIAVGGTPLFNQNVATLWGDSVVSLLSLNALDDVYGIANGQFKTNLANWLASAPEPTSLPELVGNSAPPSVPEPSTIVLLGAGLAGIGFLKRKYRK